MKERLVKGKHVLGLIRLLESHGKLETLPELVPPGADLIRKPVSPTTWYQLRAYEELLLSVHRYVFDGSELAGQRMGKLLATPHVDQLASDGIVPKTPHEAAELFAQYWKRHFNFGLVTVSEPPDEPGAVGIAISGYPEMSSGHGHLLIGWSMAAVASTLHGKVKVRLHERPWMHNSVLNFSLSSD